VLSDNIWEKRDPTEAFKGNTDSFTFRVEVTMQNLVTVGF
jgi:hypothetical protein